MNYTVIGSAVFNAKGHPIADLASPERAAEHAARLNRTVGMQAEIEVLVRYLTEIQSHVSYAPEIVGMLLADRSRVLLGATNGLRRCGIDWHRSSEGSAWPFTVQTRSTENWSSAGAYTDLDNAIRDALRLRAEYPSLPLQVVHHYQAGQP